MSKRNSSELNLKHPLFITGLLSLVIGWIVLDYQDVSGVLPLFAFIFGLIFFLVGLIMITQYFVHIDLKKYEKDLMGAGFSNLPAWQQWLLPILVILSLGLVSWFNLPTWVGYGAFAFFVSMFIVLPKNHKKDSDKNS
jgi:hypothetical protein